jgi:GH35 family endo-1,4-beta-xylanase
VGTALQYNALTADADYAAVAAREFNYITPENETKWGELQTAPGVWDFSRANALFRFAEAHGQKVKWHTLLWHNQLPAFITDTTPARDVEKFVKAHFQKVMKKYGQRVYSWDVVNEALADDGTLRDSVLSRKLGPNWVADAFKLARRFDKDAKLYYNDYGAEVINAKSNGILDLITATPRKKFPIDGVGFQMHLDGANPPSKDAIKANWKRFTDLGLTVNVSELDVRVANVPGSPARKLAVQRNVFHTVAAACVETPGCEAVTSWGFTDKYSWVDDFFGADDPLQFDEQFGKKPAYDGQIDGFLGLPIQDPDLGPNLLNGGFEEDLTGWVTWGDAVLSRDSSVAQEGAYSAMVSSRTASWQGAVAPLTTVVLPGKNYQVSAWARTSAAADQRVTLSAKVVCDGVETYSTLGDNTAAAGAWTPLTATLSVPSCASLSDIAVYVEGPDAGVDLWVDGVSLRQELGSLGDNLVANPGFESNADGWTAWGGAVISATADQAHAGSQSGVVTNRTGTWQGAVYALTSLVQPGAAYETGVWARLGSGSSAVNWTAKIDCVGSDPEYRQLGTGLADASGWTELRGALLVPDCTLEELVVYAEGAPEGVDLYVDDASVRQSL